MLTASVTGTRDHPQGGPQAEGAASAGEYGAPGTVVNQFLVGVAIAQASLFAVCAAFDGFYDFRVWGVVAILASVLLFAGVVAAPFRLSMPGLLMLAGLGTILCWGVMSVLWAESIDRVWTEVNRAGLYLAVVLTGLLAATSIDRARLVLRVLAAGVGLVTVYVLGELLVGSAGRLFLDFRLTEPLGYVNGEAGYFGIGAFAMAGVAQGADRPLERGVAAGFCVLCAGLVVLTQSRGALLAIALAAAVVVAILPRRTERLGLILVVGAGVAASLPWLLDVYEERASAAGPEPGRATVQLAGVALLAAAATAGLAWALITTWRRRKATPAMARAARAVVVLAVLAAATVAAASISDPVSAVEHRWNDFVNLDRQDQGGTRLTSAGGFRYDYWRIAVEAFERAPLKGLGAGNYATVYVRERQNEDYVQQPHSLALQLLAELGVPGAIGLALLVAGVLLGAAARPSDPKTAGLEVRVAGLGMFLAWLLHTNVDWLYNLPGVTGMALIAAAVLVGSTRDGPASGEGRTGNFGTGVAMAGLVLLAAAVSVQWMAERYEERAERLAAHDPAGAVAAANRSIALNPERIRTYVVKAAAYARGDEYSAARRVLKIAVEKEPTNYVPWALLGDLAVRRGDLRQAAADYKRASALNPYDPALRSLASSPQPEDR